MAGKEQSPTLSLRLALAGAWQVVRGRRQEHFPQVLQLLDTACRAAPGALRPRHWARLRLGLRAAAVMWMLQEKLPQGLLFQAIDSFFPEGQQEPLPQELQASHQDQAMVQEAEDSFREQILELLQDPDQREAYMQGPRQEEYGEAFLEVLEQLFYEFLERLESALPPPDIRQLMEVISSHAPQQPLPLELPILRRYLVDLGHVHCVAVPRPRPRARRLLPLEFEQDPEARPRKKVHLEVVPDPDRQRDRNRHRTHGQGGENQGEGGGEGRDPPPAAEAHLQWQADERREDSSRLQDPGGLSPPPGAGPAWRRGPALRGGRGSRGGSSPRPRPAGHAQR